MGGLVIVDPTTLLRDWLRTGLSRPNLWAGGWPDGADLPGTVMHQITSSLAGLTTTWGYQFDHWATTQPAASQAAGETLQFLARTSPRTVVGESDTGRVLFGGLIESTVSTSVRPPTSDDPDAYGHTLNCSILTIAVPLPPPTP